MHQFFFGRFHGVLLFILLGQQIRGAADHFVHDGIIAAVNFRNRAKGMEQSDFNLFSSGISCTNKINGFFIIHCKIIGYQYSHCHFDLLSFLYESSAL
jgi:hypothetical protein